MRTGARGKAHKRRVSAIACQALSPTTVNFSNTLFSGNYGGHMGKNVNPDPACYGGYPVFNDLGGNVCNPPPCKAIDDEISLTRPVTRKTNRAPNQQKGSQSGTI